MGEHADRLARRVRARRGRLALNRVPPSASGHRRATGHRSLRSRLEPDLSVGPVAERFISGLAAAGSGAPRDIVDEEVFLKNLSLRESDSPVDSPIEAETASAASEIELPFADSVRELETGERQRRCDERLESLQRPAPCFDPAVVLLDNIVELLASAHPNVSPSDVLSPQLPQRGPTRNVAVECDRAREAAPVGLERFAEEGLRCNNSAIAAQQEVDRFTVLIDRSIQVVPLPADRNVRVSRPGHCSPSPSQNRT